MSSESQGRCFLATWIGGYILVFVGASLSPQNDALIMAGFVIFFLPFECMALASILAIVGLILKSLVMVVMACNGPKLLLLLQPVVSLAALIALGDIGWNCASDMFRTLPFSMAFAGMVMFAVAQVAMALDKACIRRWGSVVEAKVCDMGRRRTSTSDDGRGVIYRHWLFVTYDLPQLAHEIAVPGLEQTHIDDCGTGTDDNSCREENEEPNPIISVGSPVQHELQLHAREKEINDIGNTKHVRTWLEIDRDLYERTSVGGMLEEVCVLPCRPRTPVLTTDSGCSHIIKAMLCSMFTIAFLVVFSVPGVVIPSDIFFTNENCCDSCGLWHVRASYIAAAICVPMTIALLVHNGSPDIGAGLEADSGPGGSNDEGVNDGDTELFTVPNHADTETV
eukprot:CAMPEP_0201603894 /NCGR_PEP_ID=MMETSP0492-20130828/4200_1 /ASSEMBLY_ACC=CAM_ASM_000837 /TAXON_ID=420259 /ORGANISM="Thalassiosira gravida, Strain GMp14c1" /LENGTH=393 /DNA_ID=CAMNT_0048067789 /DNA_START=1493 /DNA_END=2674 /DNA_ORIENTATION=+